jgi:hypothetical protein
MLVTDTPFVLVGGLFFFEAGDAARKAASNIPPRALSALEAVTHAAANAGSLQAECLATRCIACTRRPAVEAPGALPERMRV